MELTLPQAIMLNHASFVSRKTAENKSEAKREREKKGGSSVARTPVEKAEAKFVNNLPPEKMSDYMRQGWS